MGYCRCACSIFLWFHASNNFLVMLGHWSWNCWLRGFSCDLCHLIIADVLWLYLRQRFSLLIFTLLAWGFLPVNYVESTSDCLVPLPPTASLHCSQFTSLLHLLLLSSPGSFHCVSLLLSSKEVGILLSFQTQLQHHFLPLVLIHRLKAISLSSTFSDNFIHVLPMI